MNYIKPENSEENDTLAVTDLCADKWVFMVRNGELLEDEVQLVVSVVSLNVFHDWPGCGTVWAIEVDEDFPPHLLINIKRRYFQWLERRNWTIGKAHLDNYVGSAQIGFICCKL